MTDDRKSFNKLEKEANTLAAAFLMPEKLFRQVWKEKDGRLDAVAERFKVSPTAVKWRAGGLGLSEVKE